MYYVVVSITWRHRTCYFSHCQAIHADQVSAVKIFGRDVCIFVPKNLYCSKINISHKCKEWDFKICAMQLEIKSSKLIILSLYSPPTGDFNQFIMNPYDALKYLYKLRADFSICGDIKTDYLIESN
jgi:hypothetical protein